MCWLSTLAWPHMISWGRYYCLYVSEIHQERSEELYCSDRGSVGPPKAHITPTYDTRKFDDSKSRVTNVCCGDRRLLMA